MTSNAQPLQEVSLAHCLSGIIEHARGLRKTWLAHLMQRAREKDPVDATGATNELSEEDERPKTRIVLDWKGDPMTINPGDKMPLF